LWTYPGSVLGVAVLLLQQLVDQESKVTWSLTERRDLQHSDGEPVEEVLAKTSASTSSATVRLVAETTRTSTSISDVAPTLVIFDSWSDRSSFTCASSGQLPELVEEQGPAVSLFEDALA
jgi:hypothetical protein